MSNVSITSLPNELLCKIFNYLSFEEQVSTIRNVCELWKHIIDSFPVWKEYEFRCDESGNIAHMCFMLRNMPSLQRFSSGASCHPKILQELAKLQPNLKHLSVLPIVSKTFMTDIIISSHKNLEKLEVHGDVFQCSEFGKSMHYCENLKELKIVGDYGCLRSKSDFSLKIVANGAAPLKSFSFARNMFSNNLLINFFAKKAKLLVYLHIDMFSRAISDLSDDLSEASVTEIVTCCRCGNRSFRHNCIEYESFEWLEITLRKQFLNSLTELCISNCKLNNKVMRLICENCPDIEKLELLWCENVTDMGLQKIHCLSKLREFSVTRGSKITEEGVSYIAQCQTLTSLELRGCTLGFIGEQAIQTLPNLVSLSLSDFNLSDNFFRSIPEKMPQLRCLSVPLIGSDVRNYLQEQMPSLELFNSIRTELIFDDLFGI